MVAVVLRSLFIVALLASSHSTIAKVTCYKGRPAPFAGVMGHTSKEATLILGLSDGTADFDQMLLTGEKLRVHTLLSCSAGSNRYCHFQGDGGEIVILGDGQSKTVRLRRKAITSRVADESGESHLGLRPDATMPTRTYVFDRMPDPECNEIMKTVGPGISSSAPSSVDEIPASTTVTK